ncbi:MAG TPA: DUF882 domain-containing protein [Casimicrobiaceae bacterium]|nr:DUF882 domain-containing protein [Casimicrobiaceae bacterium]
MTQLASRARRRILGIGATFLAAPMLAVAPKSRASGGARTLSFENLHTGEALSLVYAAGDRYVTAALASVRHFLRDFRNAETHVIDPALLDQLHALAAATGTRAPYQVISGYRSPATNERLRREGHGVATASLHLTGQAIDIRLADVALADLRDAALALRAGGVGYYPQPDSNFVHIDTGRVRRW